MATGRVNIGGGGGGMNLYVQPSEPTKKEGIWIKGGYAKTDIVSDNVLWFAGEWANPSVKKYADIPYKASFKVSCKIGTDIYLGFGYDNTFGTVYHRVLYKYDTVNDAWTKLPDCPIALNNLNSGYQYVQMDAVGTNIYVHFASGWFYKFDTKSNVWTQLTATPGSYKAGTMCAVGTNLYLFRTSTTYNPSNFKYDTLNNMWTTLTSGGNQYLAQAIQYGVKIVLVGTGGSDSAPNNKLRIYNTITDTWEPYLADCPYSGQYAYIDGNDIHNFTSNKHYVYHILTNVWELVASEYLPIQFSDETFQNIGNYVVCLDGSGKFGNYRYNKKSKQFKEGSVVIYRISDKYGVYQTELSSLPKGLFSGPNNRLLVAFDNVYMYINGELKVDLETFYGDGTKWVKFKGA